MADNSKKKRFVYKSVIGNQNKQKHEPAPPLVDFPDDFDSFTQPNKKPKLNLEKASPVKTKPENMENFFNDIDFGDGVNDFDLNEIDKIEIAASQQLGLKSSNLKPIPKVDALDQLLEATQTSKSALNKTKPTVSSPKNKQLVNKPHTSETKSSTIYLPLSQKNDANKRKLRQSSSIATTSAAISNGVLNSNNENLEQSFQKQYHNAQKMVSEYKTQLDTIQKKFNSKDGEIKILREKLRKSSEDELRMKEKLLLLESSSKTEQSKKESDLLKEIVKLRTQLDFKEKEVSDVLERQKQNEKSRTTSYKSPKRENTMLDGFQIKDNKASKPTVQQVPVKDEQCRPTKVLTLPIDKKLGTRLKSSFIKNVKTLSSCSHLVEKLSVIDFEPFTNEQPNFVCQHTKSGCLISSVSFSNELYSSMVLLEHGDFFIVEFLNNLQKYLRYLDGLFENQIEKEILAGRVENATQEKNILNPKRKDSNTLPCLTCAHLYEIGLKSLLFLKESCIVFESVRNYLLHSFATQRAKGKKNKENKVEVRNSYAVF